MSAALRKAALTLHGLSEADRSWMLARLPEPARQDLEKLVAELESLGFSKEALPDIEALPDDALNEALPLVDEMPIDDVVTRIEKCPVPVLVNWVNEEAEWLVAQVLAQRRWSWMDAVLENIRPDKKSRLQKKPRDIVAMPGQIHARLLARLADQLEGEAALKGHMTIGEVARPISGGRITQVGKWLRSFVRRA